ncbi:hypothetical protein [Paenarthrobacter sp. 2TAF44]|uniref:hypothetical protein n=1 Tax=Paenarthrobacter sp. 2TAF44 TaxID=3233018 RepID=UPI003F9AA2B5
MKPLELQISNAAPSIDVAVLPVNTIPPGTVDDVETLGIGLAPSWRRPRSSRRRINQTILIFALSALIALAIPAVLSSATKQTGNDGDAGRPIASGNSGAATHEASPAKWRTAVLVNPWADTDTAAEASIDLPATWSVQRHEPSAEYPGLHVTVLDQDSLPVANLYFGPLADAVSCPLLPPPIVQLQHSEISTGAELLDPTLAAAFSFGLTAEAEPRGSFGLVAQTTADQVCDSPFGATVGPRSVLRFGDQLGLGNAAHQSSYARTFVSADEAQQYVRSQEFVTIKRLISSLRFAFPEDRSRMWQLPPQRRPVG